MFAHVDAESLCRKGKSSLFKNMSELAYLIRLSVLQNRRDHSRVPLTLLL